MHYLLGALAGLVWLACQPMATPPAQAAGPHTVTCIDVSRALDRCENAEVVCYRHWSTSGIGLQCRWKEAPK